MSDDDIMKLNLPTGIPFVYSLDENLNPVPNGSLQFLGDPETVKKAMEAVAAQGKSKWIFYCCFEYLLEEWGFNYVYINKIDECNKSRMHVVYIDLFFQLILVFGNNK